MSLNGIQQNSVTGEWNDIYTGETINSSPPPGSVPEGKEWTYATGCGWFLIDKDKPDYTFEEVEVSPIVYFVKNAMKFCVLAIFFGLISMVLYSFAPPLVSIYNGALLVFRLLCRFWPVTLVLLTPFIVLGIAWIFIREE